MTHPPSSRKDPRKPGTSRFWLFAPFIILITLAAGYYVFWDYLGKRILTEVKKAGLNYTSAQQTGFPTKLSIVLDKPTYQDASFEWGAGSIDVNLMPFNDEHAIVIFSDQHEVGLSLGDLTIDFAENIASAKLGIDGLKQIDLTLSEAKILGKMGYVSLDASAQNNEVHIRRNPEVTQQADFIYESDAIRLGSRANIDTLKLEADFPMDWLQVPNQWALDLRAGKSVNIRSLDIIDRDLDLTMHGTIGVDAQDRLLGKLKMQANSLRALFDRLQALGIVKAKAVRELNSLSRLSQLFAGKADTKAKINLEFKDGKSYLGKIPIGPAPRMPLPEKR